MMNPSKTYFQFCPVARAAEIVASRWTPILLRELLAGNTKFNELRIGMSKMSPSLLSKRLQELEDAGIIRKKKSKTGKGFEYLVTDIGRELMPFVMALGIWGQKYIIRELGKHELDPGLLMWDMHRRLDVDHFSKKGVFLIQVYLNDAPAGRKTWWILIRDRKPELCTQHPGLDVNFEIESCVQVLTDVWRGASSIDSARKGNQLHLKGEIAQVRSFGKWFLLSPFVGAAKADKGLDARK
jgi:DNA-binding HxlR family transcriptional regulator